MFPYQRHSFILKGKFRPSCLFTLRFKTLSFGANMNPLSLKRNYYLNYINNSKDFGHYVHNMRIEIFKLTNLIE